MFVKITDETNEINIINIKLLDNWLPDSQFKNSVVIFHLCTSTEEHKKCSVRILMEEMHQHVEFILTVRNLQDTIIKYYNTSKLHTI